MLNIFYEADLRIERAKEHLSELEIALLRFERPELVEVLTGLPKEDPRFEEEDRKTKRVFGLDNPNWPYVQLTYSPPDVPSKVLIVVGEVAYNLVAALDYIVYALAREDSGSIQNGTQWPVCEKKEFFERGRFAMLKGINSEHSILIERLQPYNGCAWTTRLKELSNLDKHRELIRADVNALRLFGSDMNSRMETPREARARRKAGLPKPPMKMYFGQTLVVTLDDGSPVVKALEILQSQVADVLVQFKRLLNIND